MQADRGTMSPFTSVGSIAGAAGRQEYFASAGTSRMKGPTRMLNPMVMFTHTAGAFQIVLMRNHRVRVIWCS